MITNHKLIYNNCQYFNMTYDICPKQYDFHAMTTYIATNRLPMMIDKVLYL
jgi:hypothetical protein